MSEILRLLSFAAEYPGKPLVLATVVRTRGSTYRRLGARMLIAPDGRSSGAVSGGCLERDVIEHARGVLEDRKPRLLTYDTRLTLGCNGVVEIFVERVPGSGGDVLNYLNQQLAIRKPALLATVFDGELPLGSYPHLAPSFPQEWTDERSRVLQTQRSALRSIDVPQSECLFGWVAPPIRLIVLGTGYDVIPVVRLGRELGWEVQVIGHPGDAGAYKGIHESEQVIVSDPAELATKLQPDAFTAAVLMTHHFGRDLAFLHALLPVGLPYLGLLGPRTRREQLLTALAENGLVPDLPMLDALRNPVGLDLGGETPEEIALSIVAEVRAVLAGRAGAPLRNRKAGIHSENPPSVCTEDRSSHATRTSTIVRA